MIDIDIFDQVCQECHGHGIQISKTWEEYFLLDNNSSNQTKTHEKPKAPIFFLCKECNGMGRIPTEKGYYRRKG